MGGPSLKQFVETKGVHETPNADYDAFDVDSPAARRRSVDNFIAGADDIVPAADMDAVVAATGIDAVFAAVSRPCTVAEALAGAEQNLRTAARNVAAALRLGARIGAA